MGALILADIVTLAEYKAYVGVTSPNQDSKLTPIVSFVNSYIHNYCNTTFEPTIVTGLRTTSYDGKEIILPNAPIISVEEVRKNHGYLNDAGTAWVTSVYDSIEYTFDPSLGYLRSYFSFSDVEDGIEVDYTYGHTQVPADLKLSALEWVTYLSKGKFTKTKSIGNGQTIDYGDPEIIPPQVKLAMNLYKVP